MAETRAKPARRMYRYEVPVDDEPHTITSTSTPPLRVEATADSRVVEFWAIDGGQFPAATTRVYQVFGTGQAVPPGAVWRGTTSRTPHGLVWHLFELEVDRGCYPIEILGARCMQCGAEPGAVCRVISDPAHPFRPEPHFYRAPVAVTVIKGGSDA